MQKEQEYKIGEKVKACGWAGSDTGIIEDINWIYHPRLGEHCWGYKIKFDGEGAGLTFSYIPEGYLRKIDDANILDTEGVFKKNWLWKTNNYMNYRIGKKQKRAILTEDGKEVVIFNKGQESLAELVCKLLNEHYQKIWVENNKCTNCGSENIKWHLSSTKECKDCKHVFRANELVNIK